MYNKYTTEDFVTDPFFIRWVKSPDEATNTFWADWIAQNPEKKQEIDKAREIVEFLEFTVQKPTEEDFMSVKLAIREQIGYGKLEVHRANGAGERESNTVIRSYFFHPLLKVAASFLVVAFLTTLYFIFTTANQNIKYFTKAGELKTVILPDNSKVVLNSNSSIEFSRSWKGQGSREVWLSGEAFFSVVKKTTVDKKNKTRIKFVVHTPNLDVEVLGTKFNVNNKSEKTKVVLNSGKIKLRLKMHDKVQNIYMNPGELVEFSTKENQLSKRSVQPEIYSSWQDKDLVFEEQSLTEIAKVLESQMGLKVIIEDASLADLKFTGTSPRNNLDVLFTSIANSFDAEVQRKNSRTIVIKVKNTMN